MKPAILCVHQVGKVGSTSVLETLRRHLPRERIFQTHVLSERAVLASIREWIGRSQARPGFQPQWNLLASIELSGRLAKGIAAADWYLLSLVREPVGRNVSAFFDNLRRGWVHHLPQDSRDLCLELLRRRPVRATPDGIHRVARELVALFQRTYPREFIDGWFDEEMKQVFGIDVFARPFARERGYEIHRNGSVHLLLLRLEDLAAAFAPGVREWLAGSPWAAAFAPSAELELRRANDSDNKPYAMLYEEFLNLLTLDANLLESEYASRTARHFYSDDELARFAAKWLKSAPAPERALSFS
ncbi:MAG: putative capsular polysaccharide synthesis family protein [Terrimicrobiaceae bacterium]|nr:putative capsular polysaccharide synthesis family protein [Terrimicrobiaceae bacterium]